MKLVNNIILSSFVVLVLVTNGYSYVENPKEVFMEALEARTNEWAPGVTNEISNKILNMQNELGVSFNEQQINDIAQGISDSSWEQEVTDIMHPYLQERNKLRILNGVQNYLTGNSNDNRNNPEIQKGLEEVKTTINEWIKSAIAMYPDKEYEINAGANNAFQSMRNYFNNPLRNDFILNVTEDTLKKAKMEFDKSLEKLSLNESYDSSIHAFKIGHIFLNSIQATLENNKSVIISDELIKAEKKLTENHSEVAEWQSSKMRERIEKSQKEMMRYVLVSEIEPIINEPLEFSDEYYFEVSETTTPIEEKLGEIIEPELETSEVMVKSNMLDIPGREENNTESALLLSSNISGYIKVLGFVIGSLMCGVLALTITCLKRKEIA